MIKQYGMMAYGTVNQENRTLVALCILLLCCSQSNVIQRYLQIDIFIFNALIKVPINVIDLLFDFHQ